MAIASVDSPSFALPGIAPPAGTSAHPLLLGASPGTTGTMSVYYALVMLGVSAVHYSRQYNATDATEANSYAVGGGPMPLLRPLFAATGAPPPVDLAAVRRADLRFLEATDALLDTPSMDMFFEALATFPNARVLLTAREPRQWAASRRARHPTDRAPLFSLLGFDAPMHALSEEQAAMALALWHRAVVASVPAERLLVLDLFAMSDEQLWTQLCAFVDRPLPRRDASGQLPSFPHQRYVRPRDLTCSTGRSAPKLKPLPCSTRARRLRRPRTSPRPA
jgi:hypothetical protein